MDPLSLARIGNTWAILSALAIIALGALTLVGGRSRPRGALAFGAFGIAWGAQIVLVNLASLAASPEVATMLWLLGASCLLVTPYLLIESAAAHTESPAHRPAWLAVRGLAAAIAATAALLLLVEPVLMFQGLRESGGQFFPRWGPLYALLVTVPHFTAFGVALVALARAHRRSPTPRLADRHGALLAGLAAYLAYASANNLVVYLQGVVYYGDGGVALAYVALFAALVTVMLRVGFVALRNARAPHVASSQRIDRLVAWIALGGVAWGAIEGILTTTLLTRLNTVGLWRLAGVGIIAYGFARWRFYDLPQRTQRAAVAAGGATAATATGVAAYGATSIAAAGTATPWLVALVVLAATLLPSLRLARRLFRSGDERARKRELEEQLYGQRIDAYRAALEASLARGTLDEDDGFLAALRERFGITPAEDRVLRHYARSSVVVQRDRNAWEAYERLRLLGEGGGGRTWLARDRSRDRLVVLKEPLERWQQEPSAREAVLREARLAARIRHPNVVSVEEVVEGKGSPVIVMEYLEGGSLADVLRTKGRLEWRAAVDLTLDVLAGLEAVHAAGIVHRDVKPSNILLTGEGSPKLADFGIALPASSGKTVVESSSTFAGTLSYVAPEVRAGASSGDRRSDVYSAAAVLHELVHGAPPGQGPVVARDDVPTALAGLLGRGLAERPEARFATARAFADELRKLTP